MEWMLNRFVYINCDKKINNVRVIPPKVSFDMPGVFDRRLQLMLNNQIIMIDGEYHKFTVETVTPNYHESIVVASYKIIKKLKLYLDILPVDIFGLILSKLDYGNLYEALGHSSHIRHHEGKKPKLLRKLYKPEIWRLMLNLKFPDMLKLSIPVGIKPKEYVTLYYDSLKVDVDIINTLENWAGTDIHIDLDEQIWKIYIYVKYNHLFKTVTTYKVFKHMMEDLCIRLEHTKRRNVIIRDIIHEGKMCKWEDIYLNQITFQYVLKHINHEPEAYDIYVVMLLTDVSTMGIEHIDLIKKFRQVKNDSVRDYQWFNYISKKFMKDYMNKIQSENPGLYALL